MTRSAPHDGAAIAPGADWKTSRMDSQPWTDPGQWADYLETTGEEQPPVDVNPDAVLGLSKEIHYKYLGRSHGRALAVTGEEPSLSATVAAAVRANWQDTPARRRPQRHPIWWSAPAGLKLDRVARALAEHLGSPVARGQNASGWVSRLLVQQRVPVLVLNDLSNLPIACREPNSLPRLMAYLVNSTSTVFVFVDPDAERVLFDVPAGIELATRTALITIPRPELVQVLPLPERRNTTR
jgi:hypothetical protein